MAKKSTAKKSTAKKSTAAKKPAAEPSAETTTSDAGVASPEENARLKHTDELRDQAAVTAAGASATAESEGSVTTRDDLTDVGVPMLQGSPDEPVGPEDALGEGPTRGDYRERITGRPHEGATPQRPRAEEIGEVEGVKGGVGTASS